MKNRNQKNKLNDEKSIIDMGGRDAGIDRTCAACLSLPHLSFDECYILFVL